jgi:hypothetical protein
MRTGEHLSMSAEEHGLVGEKPTREGNQGILGETKVHSRKRGISRAEKGYGRYSLQLGGTEE